MTFERLSEAEYRLVRGDRRAAGQGRRLCGAGGARHASWRVSSSFSNVVGLPMEVVAPWCRRRKFRYPEGAMLHLGDGFSDRRGAVQCFLGALRALTTVRICSRVKVASVIAQSGSGAQPYERKTAKSVSRWSCWPPRSAMLLYTSLGESMQSPDAPTRSWPAQPNGRASRCRSAATWCPFDRAQARHAGIRFDLQRSGQVMRAYYAIVPDTFKDESEVVLTGRLSQTEFHATEMTASARRNEEPGRAGTTGSPPSAGQTGGSKWDLSAITCC